MPPFRDIVIWTAKHIFGYQHPLVYSGSGSGDKVFDWVQVFCLLVVGLVGTGIWSVIERRRTQYNALYKWFRVFIRFVVAGQLFFLRNCQSDSDANALSISYEAVGTI